MNSLIRWLKSHLTRYRQLTKAKKFLTLFPIIIINVKITQSWRLR